MGYTLKKILTLDFYYKLPNKIRFLLMRLYHEKVLFKTASKEKIFSSIWENNYWGNPESLSGVGSTLLQTEHLREKLLLLFQEFGILSVFDAPCGDLNWMQHVLKNTKVTYIGGDIVQGIIENNNRNYKSANISFKKFDITKDQFPDSDVWICRAVLYHLSNKDIYLALERFVESKIRYILTTNCVTADDHVNKDILTGDWRSLNLMLPPFNFPKKFLWEIDDSVDPHPPMKITLWTREQIQSVMPGLRKIYES